MRGSDATLYKRCTSYTNAVVGSNRKKKITSTQQQRGQKLSFYRQTSTIISNFEKYTN